MGPDDIIMSYDVKALFTSVPIKPALKIHTETPGRRPHTSTKNHHDSEEHHLSVGVFACPVHILPSKKNFMNRWKELLWVHPSVP